MPTLYVFQILIEDMLCTSIKRLTLFFQLSKKPNYMNLQWPNLADFIKDKNQDMPKHGELMDEYCYRVSDLGIPVSEDGMKVCEKLDKEYEKRDQDIRGMCIYNDWNGWGMGEVMENLVSVAGRRWGREEVGRG